MKELLRTVLFKEYNNSLRDYLRGLSFSEEQTQQFIEFAELSMRKDIKMEQIYERAIPRALKYYPALAGELLKYKDTLEELEIGYCRLSDRDFVVVKKEGTQGVYRILINN